MKKVFLIAFVCLTAFSCKDLIKPYTTVVLNEYTYFNWGAANVYFLLTDRFYNGDTSNDKLIKRDDPTGKLRGFEGGDFAGIMKKIDEGYFTKLGVDAIWLTPVWEQVHGGVDEGTGFTYAFHGYWAKDWTAIEPSYGTQKEFQQLVDKAHAKKLRVLLDVVINHTGPVTAQDSQWPEEWVRTGPICSYQNQETAVTCTLTNNLPDIRTESTQEVSLPSQLVKKWKQEGRYEQEVKELDAFFKESGLARTPANYMIKWVTDYVRETGIDGYRVDTVKHVEETVWTTMNEQAQRAFKTWKKNNPKKMFHDDPFFVLGELYGYESSGGRAYYFNEKPVDYFDAGYDALINFGFKRHAIAPYDELFARYESFRDSLLVEKPGKPVYAMNYVSSHDDGMPFDPKREKALEAGTKLLLTPGMVQIYYGDESARPLVIEGTTGDATLRSMMNWKTMNKEVLSHWQKLGKFRSQHPAVGAGDHVQLVKQTTGVLAARIYAHAAYKDQVIIGAGLPDGHMTIPVATVFPNAKRLRNAYTNTKLPVVNGEVKVQVVHGVVLLERL
jgi:alpha-amylase